MEHTYNAQRVYFIHKSYGLRDTNKSPPGPRNRPLSAVPLILKMETAMFADALGEFHFSKRHNPEKDCQGYIIHGNKYIFGHVLLYRALRTTF